MPRETQRETKNIEFKRQLTDTFLKTVSAFANYEGGKILFGVDDDGSVVGVDDPDATMLAIENKISNMIDPRPDYDMSLDNSGIITLTIHKGRFTPYFYKNKAYKRSDTSAMEVGRLELTRLILEGSNQDFEQLPSRNQTLEFSALEREFVGGLGISALSEDTLKTLELMSPEGEFNNAGALLADQNDFPGIDIAVFGETMDEIRHRTDLGGQSLLTQFHEATNLFRQFYVSELITGSQRETLARVPEKAFREAIANALVHREWDTRSPIRVAMFEDRIEVTSPGSLPAGLSFDDYLHGQLSLLRNPIIGMVFYRLGYIERFGTGIARINNEYAGMGVLPSFTEHASSITLVLPAAGKAAHVTPDERRVLETLTPGKPESRTAIQEATGFSREKTIRLLNALVDKSTVRREGSARTTRYVR